MSIFKVLILALSSNMDDMAFGFTLGLRERVPLWVAAVIGTMRGVIMGLGMVVGRELTAWIPDGVEGWIAAGLYVILAAWFILDEWQHSDAQRAEGAPRRWSLWSALVMGAALGVDSLGLGVSAGLSGYPVALTVLLAGGMAIALIILGAAFAKVLARGLLKEKAGYFAGGLLLVLALITLWDCYLPH